MSPFWWGVLLGAGITGLPLLIIIGWALRTLAHSFDGF